MNKYRLLDWQWIESYSLFASKELMSKKDLCYFSLYKAQMIFNID